MTTAPFDPLDRQFASLLQRLAQSASERLALAALLVSRATRAGHVCIDLRCPPQFELAPEASMPPIPSFEEWRHELTASPVVGTPGEFKPLILDPQGRLYLHRYWNYETIVADGIKSRLGPLSPSAERDPVTPTTTKLPSRATTGIADSTATLLDRYFGAESSGAPDWQRRAVQTALTRRFAVISGGPGTGKTYAIAVLVAALLESGGEAPPRIALAAPTGKAAVRLQEAISAARERLPCSPAVRDRLPTTASTLHRLLGARPGTASFRHNAAHPLPFDVILIDEASMVDVALMAKLIAACPPDARLVLVGDMNQLASVEAGSVLGDICDRVRAGSQASELRSVDRSEEIQPGKGADALVASIVQLRKNHRFRDGEGIAALGVALNRGETDDARRLLRSGDDNLGERSLPPPDLIAKHLGEVVHRHFAALLAARSPGDALRQLGEFRILCALRRGPYGTESINSGIERALRACGQVTTPTAFYPGRPILIRKNDYSLRLFNGDVGLVLRDGESGELRVWFFDVEGNARSFAPGRLPEHETVFAMTVHQSQGSEYSEVLLILPDRDSPVLTRELLYTGVTRARRRVELWLAEGTLPRALARRIERTSGLADRLWGCSSSSGSAVE